jgi:MoxR-like ATPase
MPTTSSSSAARDPREGRPVHDMRPVARAIETVVQALAQVVTVPDATLKHLLLAVVCGGHVLIEDVPGVGKTTLARALAQTLGLEFQRVQGTPDRLPAEITGVSVWDSQRSAFRFVEGPLFGQCVLFDELNRAPAKTQAALLEAMEEGQVTVDGRAHRLPRPFLVLATQNPIELEGTFPLPEAALDRFFVHIQIGYPTAEEEVRLLQRWEPPVWRIDAAAEMPPQEVVLSAADLFGVRRHITQGVYVGEEAVRYLVTLARATRAHSDVALGVSPRAALALKQAAQAWAAFAGRNHVVPDDIQAVFVPVVAHRLILTTEADLREQPAAAILDEIVATTPVNGSWAGLVDGAPRAGHDAADGRVAAGRVR